MLYTPKTKKIVVEILITAAIMRYKNLLFKVTKINKMLVRNVRDLVNSIVVLRRFLLSEKSVSKCFIWRVYHPKYIGLLVT